MNVAMPTSAVLMEEPDVEVAIIDGDDAEEEE
jgi:hypothetical protein